MVSVVLKAWGAGGAHTQREFHEPMPLFRQFLLTLSIAMYPLFATCLCMLCLQTITPIGSDGSSSAYALVWVIDVRETDAGRTEVALDSRGTRGEACEVVRTEIRRDKGRTIRGGSIDRCRQRRARCFRTAFSTRYIDSKWRKISPELVLNECHDVWDIWLAFVLPIHNRHRGKRERGDGTRACRVDFSGSDFLLFTVMT